MPEAYAAALRDAKAGATVGPFQTEGGWAVLRVEDRRRETPPTLEQARPQIVRFLTYDEVRDLLEQLRGQAKVEMLLKPSRRRPAVPGAPEAARAGARRPLRPPTPSRRQEPPVSRRREQDRASSPARASRTGHREGAGPAAPRR